MDARERLDGPVTLAGPDPAWPAEFARQAARIRRALAGRALLVEHVGSTSVPGLLAKPVIDIVLAVADAAAEEDYVPDLEAAGFVFAIREPDWYEHRLLRGTDPRVNLHVFPDGSPEIARMLAFRDRLRADAGARRRYADAKRALAARHWRFMQDYADAKTGTIDDILARG